MHLPGTSSFPADCSAPSGNGEDYGSKFYFYDDNYPFQAGYDKGATVSCIGIVVSSWSSTQVVFTLGADFNDNFFTVNNNDHYVVYLKGFPYGGLVSGLS
jgi:hypothetical protein